MYQKFEQQMTNKVRLLTALVLFMGGMIWQLASEKVLDMYAFYILAAAFVTLSSVIVGKMSGTTPGFLSYVLGNMLLVIAGFSITSMDIVDGVTMYMIWGICVVADWIVNAVVLPCESTIKRVIMGLAATMIHILLIGIVFVGAVLLQVF